MFVKKRSPAGSSSEKKTWTTKHPWLIACDANMSPEDFEKSLCLVSERSNASDSTRGSVHVQIKKMPKENGWRRYVIMSYVAVAWKEKVRHEGDIRFRIKE